MPIAEGSMSRVTRKAVERGARALEQTGSITAAAEAMGLKRTSTPHARTLLKTVLGIEAPKRSFTRGGCGTCPRCRKNLREKGSYA